MTERAPRSRRVADPTRKTGALSAICKGVAEAIRATTLTERNHPTAIVTFHMSELGIQAHDAHDDVQDLFKGRGRDRVSRSKESGAERTRHFTGLEVAEWLGGVEPDIGVLATTGEAVVHGCSFTANKGKYRGASMYSSAVIDELTVAVHGESVTVKAKTHSVIKHRH